MPSFEYDLAFLQAGIPELQNYLLSNEIYWPLGVRTPHGEPPYPRMTLGWLLLFLARGRGRQTSGSFPSQASALDRFAGQLETVRSKWKVAWENKAAQEFRSRLKLWMNFINDYRQDRVGHANRYGYEVQRRAMLHLLRQEARDIPKTELDLLKGMDNFLRSALRPGDFVWDEQIAAGFPRDVYWYLYGSLRGN